MTTHNMLYKSIFRASQVDPSAVCWATDVISWVYSHAINDVLIKEKLPDKQLFAKGGLVTDNCIG